MRAVPQPTIFQQMGKTCLATCLTSGVHRPLQGSLQHHFGKRLYLKGFRAWVGRVAQEVMEKNGYKRNGDERKEVKGNEFGRAACFKKC